MTNERMALLELLEKGADADLIRELLAYASERLMEAEVDRLTGAAAGVRSPDRTNHRNGYRGVVGRHGSAGSNSRSRSCARARTSRLSWSRVAPRRRP